MSLFKTALESAMVNRLGWVLLHFIWEGVLIALLLGGLLMVLRRSSASLRYGACIGAMVLLSLAPVLTFVLVPSRVMMAEASAAAPVVRSGTAAPRPQVPAGPAHSVEKARPAAAAPVAAGQLPTGGRVADRSAVAPGEVASAAPSRPWREVVVGWLTRALPWLVAAWGVGALFLSIWNLGGWMAVRRLRLMATSAVSAELAATGDRLAKKMGIGRRIRFLQSALVDSPMVIGALRPVILLPVALLSGISPAQVEALLVHELAHIRRHDYLVNLLQGIVETLLFYHPAVWWVSRRIRIERENCCDDQVVSVTRDRSTYVRALAALAESSAQRQMGFALAASGGVLLGRIRRMLGLPDADAARSPRWLAGAVALLLCVFATGVVISRAADGPAKDKDFDAPKPWVLEFQVTDKELGEPLAKVSLAVQADNRRFSYITDEQGRAHIEYPQGTKYLQIVPKMEKYVPVTVSWRNYGKSDPVPGNFKLELERGTTIGGTIKDEAGKPVEGVSVQLSMRIPGQDFRSHVQPNLYNLPIRTDDQGHWRCDVAPKAMSEVYVRISHPDFVSDEMFGMTPVPSLKELREQKSVMVLQKGVAVSGRVVDGMGRAVKGASVLMGSDRFGSNYPQTKTDAQGKFSFAHCRTRQEMVLTVTAKGYSPDQVSFPLDKERSDLEFKLEPGHVIKGRVVDQAGKSVGKVMIATDTWRGHRALTERFDTDDQGNFAWNDAPADEVLTDFLKQGYMDQRRVAIKPSDKELVITLQRPIHVTGTVVDSETGKPVEGFRVIQGIKWDNQADVSWLRDQSDVHPKEGTFDFDLTYPYPAYAVRIEADGYLAADSDPFKGEKETVSLEFKLKKGQSQVGLLRTAEGKPLADAEIAIATGNFGPYITNGEITQRDQVKMIRSDSTGHYTLPPQTGKFLLVVVDPQGYAEVKSDQLKNSRDITVQAWGHVRGTLQIGTKSGAGKTMYISRFEQEDRATPRVYHDLRAGTDSQGHFSFDRVPPGKAMIAEQVRISESTYGYTQTRTIEVKAGETTDVEVGGKGRPVIGHLVLPPELKGASLVFDNTNFMTKVETPANMYPPNWKTMTAAEHNKYLEDYAKTKAFQEYRRQLDDRHSFTVKVKSDGSFRVEDVPAGTYQFFSVIRPPNNAGRFGGQAVASANIDFTVPEIPGGRSDEPFDIGGVQVKAAEHPDAPKGKK